MVAQNMKMENEFYLLKSKSGIPLRILDKDTVTWVMSLGARPNYTRISEGEARLLEPAIRDYRESLKTIA